MTGIGEVKNQIKIFKMSSNKCIVNELGEVTSHRISKMCLNIAPILISGPPKYFHVFSTNICTRYSLYQSPVFHTISPITCAKYKLPYFIINNQRDETLSSLYLLPNQSTCFGCSLHPSSGVHKTLVTTTGTSHVLV